MYLFHGAGGEVLYVGKATNLRQRVRTYFGSDDRRKIGPLLRETQRGRQPRHGRRRDRRGAGDALPPRSSTPRYNRVGTTWRRYCYVRLTTDERGRG